MDDATFEELFGGPAGERDKGYAPVDEEEVQRYPLEMKDKPGYIMNPDTNRAVKADGPTGRKIAARKLAELSDKVIKLPDGRELAVLPPRGKLGESKTSTAQPDGPTKSGKFKQKYAPAGYAPAGQLRAYGAYRTQQYRLERAILTQAEFAKSIHSVIRTIPNMRNVVVHYLDADDTKLAKSFPASTTMTPTQILNTLVALSSGESLESATQSDPLKSAWAPDFSMFSVGYVVYGRAAGLEFKGISRKEARKHPHFQLVELAAKAAENDCFLAVVRAVARAHGLELPKVEGKTAHNSTIRDKLVLGAGAISMDDETVDKVARLFGLRIRVMTGMAVVPDNQREYDDDACRQTGRNLCTTDPQPVVIAEGGEADAPPCPVYYADGHCEYVSRILEPIPTCPVTGDILIDGKQLSITEKRTRVLQQGRRWHARTRAAKTAEDTKMEERVIVFDYETVYTSSGEIEPYALGFMLLEPGHEFGDFKDAGDSVTQTFRKHNESKYAVTTPLLNMLDTAPDHVRYKLVSFNGARFDHYLLAQAAHRRGLLSSVFTTPGGGLRALKIGRHATLDLAKLIPGMSLKTCCTEFATMPKKVDGFSHTIPQQAFAAGHLYEWMHTNAGELSEYLAGDVLSTASLFVKLRSALITITGIDILSPKAPGTIGGIAWKMMTATCRLPAAVDDVITDTYIRSAITGGRVQVYGKAPVIRKGRPLRMGDVVSLYPTAMAAVSKVAALFSEADRWGCYPDAGSIKPVAVTEYEPGHVGVYSITIHSQPEGLPNVLPKRVEGEPLDWAYRGEFDTVATHIDIALIQQGGGRVTVHSGLRWPTTTNTLFRPYIEHLARLKNNEDILKQNKDPSFNAALRSTYKLLMNSASGKCCQRNYDDVTVLATGSAAQIAAERKMSPDHPVTWLELGGETVILSGKKPKEQVYRATYAKPSILAVLIYAYSRAYVWKTLCKHNVLYSDTDSGLFEVEDWERLCAEFPQLIPTGRPKELGDLEEELGEHDVANAYLKAPKDYAVLTKLGGVATAKQKIRIKGVNMALDKAGEPVGDRVVSSEEACAELEAMDAHQLEKEYSGPATELTSRIRDDVDAFFEKHAAGTVTVMCSQIARTNLDRGSGAAFSLRQRFLLKDI